LIYHTALARAMKKQLPFVIYLCVMVSLAMPIYSIVTELPEIFGKGFEEVKEMEDVTNVNLTESLIAVSKSEIEEAVASYISEIYGIAGERISVETVLNAEDPSAIEISEIRVVLAGDVSTDTEAIRRALDEMFLGKSEITVIKEN
jgi:hypothetical protein